MRFSSTSPLLLLGLILAGCAGLSPQPRELDLEPPEQWTASLPEGVVPSEEAALSGDSWWQGFGDPALGAAIEEGLANNRDLVAAAARLRQAEARARIAGADLAPQVSAGLNASRSRRNFIGFPIPGSEGGVLSSTTTSFGVSLNLSWEADLWGRLAAGKRAAAADASSARWQLEGARLSLAGQIAKAWFAAVEAGNQLSLARESLESRGASREKIRRRYDAGLRPALDLRLALANEEGTVAQVAARERQLDASLRQLEILLGRYPAAEAETQDLPGALPPVAPGLPAELVRRRPDLLAAENRLAASGSRVREARAALYPRLTLTGSGGTASEELEDLLDGDFAVWNIAAGLLQPIFQGGRLRAAVELAEAGADEALASYAQGVLMAFGEVESALAAEEFLARQERALEASADQARAAVRLADERYLAGIGDILEVLESERAAVDARSRLLEVQRLQLSARVDLHLALGGGFGL